MEPNWITCLYKNGVASPVLFVGVQHSVRSIGKMIHFRNEHPQIGGGGDVSDAEKYLR